MRSTNSKPQPSNQFPIDKIKKDIHICLFEKLFHSAMSLNREQKDYCNFFKGIVHFEIN